jgi:hypothetical protein
VDDGVGAPLLESARGLQCCLDGADPAAERLEPVEKRELPLGGRDDEQHAEDASGWSGAAGAAPLHCTLLALYPGAYHGWDLLEQAPFNQRV